MFCSQCGAPLQEGAKFCTNCGTQIPGAPVPPPAAPEVPATPAPAEQPPEVITPPVEVPAAPVETPAPPAEAPAQPTEAPTQPTETPAQPTEAPAQPAEPPATPIPPAQTVAWGAPVGQAPAQSAQPQADAQPPAQTVAWQQPPQSPQWQTPPDPAQPKKKGKGLLIGIIAVVVVAALVCVGGFVWPGFFRSQSKTVSPVEYYRAVETESIGAMSAQAAKVYDKLVLRYANTDSLGASGSLRVEPGDRVRQMLVDALGDTLKFINPDEDFSWFQAIGADYDVSRVGQMLARNAALQLNGSDLLHMDLIADTETGTLWLKVPELSDRVLQTTTEDLDLGDLLPDGSGDAGSLDLGFAGKLDALMKALPEADALEALLNKYLKEAVAQIENVEQREGTMTVDEVAADYTVLVATVDADAAIRIVEALGPELREDPTVKSLLVGIANAQGKDGEAEYREFQTRIDELLADHAKITEKMQNDVVITVYLDQDAGIHGRIIEWGQRKLELLMPENNGQFGMLIRCADENGQKFMLFGSGRRDGDALTGTLELEAAGEYYGIIELDGFDLGKLMDGTLSGGMVLRPSASFWSLLGRKLGDAGLDVPDSIMSLLPALSFRLDLNTETERTQAALTVMSGSDKLATVTLDNAMTDAKPIQTAQGVEPDDWAEDITLEKLQALVDSLGNAGVPQTYVDLLESLLYFAMD